MPCLCAWVLTSVDEVTAGEATSHLVEAPQHHEWTLHDLSIIWRTLLGRGHIRPLLRGFELFQRVKDEKMNYVIRERDFKTLAERTAVFLPPV